MALPVPTCRNANAYHSRPKMSYRLPLIAFVVLYITLQLPMRLFKLCTIFDVPRFPLLHAFPFSISVVAFGFWVLNALPFRLVVLCIYRWTHLRYIGVYYVFLLCYMSFRRPTRQKVRPLFILSFVYVFLYQGFPFLAVNPFL